MNYKKLYYQELRLRKEAEKEISDLHDEIYQSKQAKEIWFWKESTGTLRDAAIVAYSATKIGKTAILKCNDADGENLKLMIADIGIN